MTLEISVYGTLQGVYKFLPEILDKIPTAEQVRVHPERGGMMFRIPETKRSVFERLALQHGLATIIWGAQA